MSSLPLNITMLMYFSLCAMATFQLGRILFYRHSLQSFHFGFLLLVFLWTFLRLIFFLQTGPWPPWLSEFLFWLPVDIQFATFALLILYFIYLLNPETWNYRRNTLRGLYLTINTLVLCMTPMYIMVGESVSPASLERAHHFYMAIQCLLLITVYAFYGYRVLMSMNHIHVLDASASNIAVLTILGWLTFTSRGIYCMGAAFDVFSIDVGGDAGGRKTVSGYALMLLFFWEAVPTLTVLMFFRSIPTTEPRFAWLGFLQSACCRPVPSEEDSSPNSNSAWSPYGTFEEKDSGFGSMTGSPIPSPRVVCYTVAADGTLHVTTGMTARAYSSPQLGKKVQWQTRDLASDISLSSQDSLEGAPPSRHWMPTSSSFIV